MKFLNWLFKNDSLSKALNPEKRIKLHGIRFTIRKVNPMDYLAGLNALVKKYDVYQKAEKGAPDMSPAQVAGWKQHYRDVLLGGVVSVRCLGKELTPTVKEISPEEKDKKIPVDNLLTDWSLAEALYTEIMVFTYGKKKLRSLISQKQS